MPDEREYVLGTHDAELKRLGLQNAAWHPRATAGDPSVGALVRQRRATVPRRLLSAPVLVASVARK